MTINQLVIVRKIMLIKFLRFYESIYIRYKLTRFNTENVHIIRNYCNVFKNTYI
jgi:hypothetical protein